MSDYAIRVLAMICESIRRMRYSNPAHSVKDIWFPVKQLDYWLKVVAQEENPYFENKHWNPSINTSSPNLKWYGLSQSRELLQTPCLFDVKYKATNVGRKIRFYKLSSDFPVCIDCLYSDEFINIKLFTQELVDWLLDLEILPPTAESE